MSPERLFVGKRTLPEQSPEIVAKLEKVRAFKREMFGEESLKAVRDSQKPDAFAQDKEKLVAWHETHPWYKRNFVIVCEEIARRKPGIAARLSDPEQFIDVLKAGAVSDADFAEFIDGHNNWLQEEQHELENFFEKTKVEFLEAVQKAVVEGVFPKVDFEKIERRVSELRVFVYDPLKGDDHHVSLASYGQFYIQMVPRQLLRLHDTAYRTRALFHELVHASLSGKKMVTTNEEDPLYAAQEEKVGLGFLKDRSSKGQWRGFMWLNEAMTEILTRSLLGREETDGIYFAEQEVLYRLVDEGVPIRLFFNAFTEDYRAGEKGVRLPALHALILKIREVKGVNWLREQERKFDTASCEA